MNPPRPFLRLVCWAAVAAVVFCIAAFPLRSSTDEWWHIKTGKWIVEHHFHLPDNDIFSYTSENYPWDNHEWLSDSIMFLIYRWAGNDDMNGWRALIVVKALWLAGVYLLLGRFLEQRAGGGARGLWIAVFVTLLAASAGKRMFWPRPPVITDLFMVFFLYVMWLHRSGRLPVKYLAVLPLLMPVWANLHGGFIVGGLIVAAYFGGELLEWLWLLWRRRAAATEFAADLDAKRFRVLTYLALGVFCGLGSLITPYGYKLYLLTSRVMKSKELVSRLSELEPPRLEFTWGYDFLLLLVAGGFVTLAVRALRGLKPRWPPLGEILLVAFFAQQSIFHVRHLILFGLAAAPVAAWLLREAWGGEEEQAGASAPRAPEESGPAADDDNLISTAPARARVARNALAGGALVCASWLVFFPGEGIPTLRALPEIVRRGEALPPSALDRCVELLNGKTEEPFTYPRQAMAFILRTRPPGRMYNRNHVCGYLIWALSPEKYKLFTDNRFDIFGGDFLMDELSIANGWPDGRLAPYGTPVTDWRKVVEKWKVNWLFVEKSEKIDEKLRSGEEKGWLLIYEDLQYAIWLKDTPENRLWREKTLSGK